MIWIVGVVLVTVASAGSTVGIILMKKSFGDSGEHETLKDKLIWVAGLAMMVGGAILDFVAFGFAAQSLIAPLGSVTLLCNVVLSPLLLGEKVAMTDWISAAIITVGCTLAISFGDHETKTYKFDELMDLYDNPAVQAYLPLVGITTAAFFAFNVVLEGPAREEAMKVARTASDAPPMSDSVTIDRNKLVDLSAATDAPSSTDRSDVSSSDESEHTQPVVLPGGFLVGFKPGEAESETDDAALQPLSPKHAAHNCDVAKVVHTEKQKGADAPGQENGDGQLTPQQILPFIPAKFQMLHGFFYAAAGGLVGSCSVLFGKTVTEIIKPGLIDGDGTAWSHFATYLILIAMGGTLFIQMKGLNKGLEYHPAVYIVPVYQTFWILGSIVGGGLYFKEFENLSQLGVVMFTIGVLTVIGGVFVLTYFRWDSEMAKYREAFGLEPNGEENCVKPIDCVGVEPKSSTLPTMGPTKLDNPPHRVVVVVNRDEESTDDPNALNCTPSPSPSYTTRSDLSTSPSTPMPRQNRLPPINHIKNTARNPQSHSKTDGAARAEMRKKRILRKKKLGSP